MRTAHILAVLWRRLETCGRLPIGLLDACAAFPQGALKAGRRITNPPQVDNPMSLTLYSVFIVAGPGIPRPYVHTYQNSGTHVGSAADRILTL